MDKKQPYHCNEYAEVTRRDFLLDGFRSAAGLFFGGFNSSISRYLPRITLADPHVGPRGDTLVCVFLRGGADGLNIVVPHGDDQYYAQRPTIHIPRPDDNAELKALDLDGFFGLHPALASLHEIYQAGDMAVVQATGSPDETRSHFEAMDLMERGAVPGEYTGWLARHLGSLQTGNDSALRAIAVGDMLPQSLSGSLNATALQSVAAYHLHGRDEQIGELQQTLQAFYADQQAGLLQEAAAQTFSSLNMLEKVSQQNYRPNGRGYGERPFGQALQTVAQLVHADVGVEVACLDLGGWDTHVGQGGTNGLMARLLTELGEGLAAFYEDLADKRDRVTVMVMSEFGRRAGENAGLGTDHGHGNMMMLLGGGIHGGQVLADWPGLHPDVLTGPGDLAITTDYRDVLGEVLQKRLNNPQMTAVFPNYSVTEHGLCVPRV